MAKPIISKGGRDQSGPEINAMNAPDRLGKVRKMVQLKPPAQGHVDAGGVVSRKPAGGVGGGVVSKKQPAISAFVGRMVAEGRSKGRC